MREAAIRRRRETAAVLADHRRAAGLSQTELAARMGTSQSSVARIEAGEVDPRVSTLERYAAALGGRLDVTLRFDPAHPAAQPFVSPDPTVRQFPGVPGFQPGIAPAAAHLSPPHDPTAVNPAARPSDRRW